MFGAAVRISPPSSRQINFSNKKKKKENKKPAVWVKQLIRNKNLMVEREKKQQHFNSFLIILLKRV